MGTYCEQPDNAAHGHLVAEAYLKGPAVFGMWLTETIQCYEAIVATGKPPAPTAVRHTPSGASAVTVFPTNLKVVCYL